MTPNVRPLEAKGFDAWLPLWDGYNSFYRNEVAAEVTENTDGFFGLVAEHDGDLIGERTHAPYHQHFLVARLDLGVDGGAVRACVGTHGPVGLVHFDTHTDTGREVFGAGLSHGTIMGKLVEAGSVDPERYVQIGLRGYWPGEEEFAWQKHRGITSLFMHEVRDLGIEEVTNRAVEVVGSGPVFLTVDIDVLDPAFAAGTGTPEPGGMTTVELPWAVREVARRLDVVGADMVEVIPTGVGSADVTALAADRIVREIPGGIALHRNEKERQQKEEA